MERTNLHINRLAVSVFFFVNGFLHANLMARLPLFQSNLGISNGVLGVLLFTVAIGALMGMPVSGGLAERYGSDRIASLAAIILCFIVPLIPAFPNIWITGFLFMSMGLTMGSMDVCMNGQAVLVERHLQKPVMSSFHAVFSIGMTLGAGVGALFSKLGSPLTQHILLMAAVSLGLILWSSGRLLRESEEKKAKSPEYRGFSLPDKAIIPLGLIAFCCMTGEGSMADWSAIYMNKVVGKDRAFSAVAFAIFATGMTLGRVFGDYLTQELGKRRLMIYDALLAISGLGIALAYVSAATTLLGFFMVGLGVSTIVPIVFSTAGNTKGVHPSVGIAMATSIGYTGFFIGPPLIGFLSDHFGLRIGLGFPLLLFCAMYLLVWKYIVQPPAGDRDPA